MPGSIDLVYVAARRLLLDGLDALAPHLAALTLVGAQAIYLHVGNADLQIAEHTTDGDLAITPDLLASEPLVEIALAESGFLPGAQPGIWLKSGSVAKALDLLVPEGVAHPVGRRAARIPPHGNRVARRVRGLEAALVDRAPLEIRSLEPEDPRVHELHVAGPAALLVAKAIKLAERADQPSRLLGKDALDVLRLLRGCESEFLASALLLLADDPVSTTVTLEALTFLSEHFQDARAFGPRLAAEAAQPVEDPEEIALSCAILVREVLSLTGR